MSLYEPPMRVRVRDRHQHTPMGLWGKEGAIIAVEGPAVQGGEHTDGSQQVYSVLFDGDSAPMKVFEDWLEQAPNIP